MKNLNDLISQITDEKILKVLNDLAASEGGWVSIDEQTFLCNISTAKATIEVAKDNLKYFKEKLRVYPGIYKKRITWLKRQIKLLSPWLDKAYFYVVEDNEMIDFVDSAQKCVEFFSNE